MKDRLTKRDSDGQLFVKEEERLLNANGVITKDEMYKIMMHLAENLAEYEDLEEQGLLLRLPCKVGDMVYHIMNNTDACMDCCHYSDFYGMDSMCSKTKGNTIFEPRWKDMPVCDDQFLEIGEMIADLKYIVSHFDDFGKTAFLTREEAEKALEKMKGGAE